METTVRRLARSRRDRVFAGVCGGLAAYMGLDPVLVRVLYVALTLLSWGTGILIYLLAWIIIPVESEEASAAGAPKDESSLRDSRRIFGVLLVIVGLLSLAATALPWFHLFHGMRTAGPIVLIAIGLALLIWKREPIAPPADSARPYAAEEGAKPRGTTGDYSEPKRLVRVEHGHKVAGVCSGLGEYFNIDPTIVRLLFIAGIFAGGAGVILYLIMWIVVPMRHDIPVSRVGV